MILRHSFLTKVIMNPNCGMMSNDNAVGAMLTFVKNY